jgi:hypothetical protein
VRTAARRTTMAEETPEFKAFWEPSYLHECFAYNPETGDLVWKVRPRAHFVSDRAHKIWNKNHSGRRLKGNNNGYLRTCINKHSVYAHRIIWRMVYGEDALVIDHINGDGTDNRLVNLRSVTHAVNSRNAARRHGRVSGVYKHSQVIGWYAQVVMSGKVKTKLFLTKEEAVEWRLENARANGFTDRHLGVSQ